MIINTDLIYPIGAIYLSVSATNPEILFGGKWEQIKDKFLLAAGDTYNAGSTGGAATVTLQNTHLPVLTGTLPHLAGDESSVTGICSHISSGSSYKEGNPSGTSITTKHQIKIGGGTAHENMPPYLTVYVWKRVS